MSEACRDCPFVSGAGEVGTAITDIWQVCARPSDICLAAFHKLEAKIAATKRLRALADLCGPEILDLSRLLSGDTLHLYASKPMTGYGHDGSRQLSVLVDSLRELSNRDDPLVTASAVQGRVVYDTYNFLPETQPQRSLAVSEGSDIIIQGALGKPDERRLGLLVVGAHALYELPATPESPHPRVYGMMLQEVAITDPAGVTQMMWGTDPATFAVAGDFLGNEWTGFSDPAAGTLDS